MIKKIIPYGMPLALLLLLAGCFKRPYHAYKANYKTDNAQVYADKAIDPAQATKKSIKHMNIAEARAARIYFEAQDEVELIEKCLTHIMKISDNYQEKGDCLYQLATIQLSLGRLEKARELFDQLISTYPGIAVKKEACYRRILAHYWDCSDAERDQSMTEKTVQLIRDFHAAFPGSVDYRPLLDTLEQECFIVLLKAELLRMNFYLTRYRITPLQESLYAAQMRLGYILESLLEYQKNISSAEKDRLCDIFVELKNLEDNDSNKRYALLNDAYTRIQEGIREK